VGVFEWLVDQGFVYSRVFRRLVAQGFGYSRMFEWLAEQGFVYSREFEWLVEQGLQHFGVLKRLAEQGFCYFGISPGLLWQSLHGDRERFSHFVGDADRGCGQRSCGSELGGDWRADCSQAGRSSFR
jgi:hypothetical protein